MTYCTTYSIVTRRINSLMHLDECHSMFNSSYFVLVTQRLNVCGPRNNLTAQIKKIHISRQRAHTKNWSVSQSVRVFDNTHLVIIPFISMSVYEHIHCTLQWHLVCTIGIETMHCRAAAVHGMDVSVAAADNDVGRRVLYQR